MKKTYTTPEIIVNSFALFENVYTACNKNPSRTTCIFSEDFRENGHGVNPSDYSHHNNLSGTIS